MHVTPQLRAEILKFGIAGVGSNTINYGAYVLCISLGVKLFTASITGYFSGLLLSYCLGRFWVFKSTSRSSLGKALIYLGVYTFGGFSMSYINDYLNSSAGLDYRLSWLIAAIFAVLNNFLGTKYLVFNKA